MLLKLTLTLAFTLTTAAQQTPHTLPYAPGKSITLSLPADLDIAVAATGIKRARFFAQAPDGRIFVTSMYNLADNTNGALYILDGWNAETHTFTHVIPYLQHLRNPNNIAFYTDDAHQTWLYLPLTDRLVRYKYDPGDKAPSGPPQLLIRFPDYGLNYKYGGWHLTRTVAVATLHGATRIYITTGSSCNYCREREAVRASLIAMDPDGSHQQVLAHGLRNAVDLQFVPNLDRGSLFATNMGDDHLGERLPEDTFFELDSNRHPGPIAEATAPNYGWPTCYFGNGYPIHDVTPLPSDHGPKDKIIAPKPAGAPIRNPANATKSPVPTDSVYGAQTGVAAAGTNLAAQVHDNKDLADLGPVPEPLSSCKDVPRAYTTFAAHSSPLGFAYFGSTNPILKNTFIVALHGASRPSIGTGYRVVRFTNRDRKPEDFITGFLTLDDAGKPLVHGRPCGILSTAPDTFFLTDDYLGLIYYIFPKLSSSNP
jgi:glucose/arabinose dehydrogenase